MVASGHFFHNSRIAFCQQQSAIRNIILGKHYIYVLSKQNDSIELNYNI